LTLNGSYDIFSAVDEALAEVVKGTNGPEPKDLADGDGGFP
jgi:hypothetical protein